MLVAVLLFCLIDLTRYHHINEHIEAIDFRLFLLCNFPLFYDSGKLHMIIVPRSIVEQTKRCT